MNIVSGFMSNLAMGLLVDRVNQLFYILGLAFGPDHAVHFSKLSKDEQKEMFKRVPVLLTNHEDWPSFLQWVPRTVTTWKIDGPPPIIAGNTQDPKPIPDNGKWFVARGYLAWTTQEGIYVRFGFRYDDVDNYINFPSITVKKVN